MPFIHIRSLPLGESRDISRVLEGLCHDFAEDTGVELKHIHATWDFLTPGCYVVAGNARDKQPKSSHPLLVDLLAPDFNEAAQIETMLKSVASSLSRRASISRSNIFINLQQARSGMVFDAGRVERW